jgi:hypothetical protein
MEAPSFSLTKKPREQQMLNVWKNLSVFSRVAWPSEENPHNTKNG